MMLMMMMLLMVVGGRTSRKTARTQRGIVCVRGVRKLRLVMATANTIVRMFIRNVNSR